MAQKQKRPRNASGASTWKQQQELESLSAALLECCSSRSIFNDSGPSTAFDTATSHISRGQTPANVQPRQLAQRLAAVFEFLAPSKQAESPLQESELSWTCLGADIEGNVSRNVPGEEVSKHRLEVAAAAIQNIITDNSASTAFSESFVHSCLFLAWLRGVGEEAEEVMRQSIILVNQQERFNPPALLSQAASTPFSASVCTAAASSTIPSATGLEVVCSSCVPLYTSASASKSAASLTSPSLLQAFADDLPASGRWRLSTQTYATLLLMTHGTPSMLNMLALHRAAPSAECPICSPPVSSGTISAPTCMVPGPTTGCGSDAYKSRPDNAMPLDLLGKLFAHEPRLAVNAVTCLAPPQLLFWAVTLASPVHHLPTEFKTSSKPERVLQAHRLQSKLLHLLFRGLSLCATERVPVQLPIASSSTVSSARETDIVQHQSCEDISQRLTCLLLLACCELELLQSIAPGLKSSESQHPPQEEMPSSLLLECSSALENCACAWQMDVADILQDAPLLDESEAEGGSPLGKPDHNQTEVGAAQWIPKIKAIREKSKAVAQQLVALIQPLQCALSAIIQQHLSGDPTSATAALPFATAFQLNARLSLLNASASAHSTSTMQASATLPSACSCRHTSIQATSQSLDNTFPMQQQSAESSNILRSPFLPLISQFKHILNASAHVRLCECSKLFPLLHSTYEHDALRRICNPYAQHPDNSGGSSGGNQGCGETLSTLPPSKTVQPSASAPGSWRKGSQLQLAEQLAMQSVPMQMGMMSCGMQGGLAAAVVSALSIAASNSKQATASVASIVPGTSHTSWRQTGPRKATPATGLAPGIATAAAGAAITADTAGTELPIFAQNLSDAWQIKLCGIAAAFLTPGLTPCCSFSATSSQLMQQQGGTDSYSNFRTAVLMLELMDVVSTATGDSSGYGGPSNVDGSHADSLETVSWRAEEDIGFLSVKQNQTSAKWAGCNDGSELSFVAGIVPLMLQLAVQALQHVHSPLEQQLLQRLMVDSSQHARSSAAQQASPTLSIAAAQALVPISNRLTRQQTSLESSGTALGSVAESARLAAASRELLPFALLQPAVLLRRLIANSIASRDQHQMVVQLLQSFRRCLALVSVMKSSSRSSSSDVVACSGNRSESSGADDSSSGMSMPGVNSIHVSASDAAAGRSMLVEVLCAALRPATCIVQSEGERANFLELLRVLLEAGLVSKGELSQHLVLDMGSRCLGADPNLGSAPFRNGKLAEQESTDVSCSAAWQGLLMSAQQQHNQQPQHSPSTVPCRMVPGFDNAQLQLLRSLLEIAAITLDYIPSAASQPAKSQAGSGEGVSGLLLLLVAVAEELCNVWSGRQLLQVQSLEMAWNLVDLYAVRCSTVLQLHNNVCLPADAEQLSHASLDSKSPHQQQQQQQQQSASMWWLNDITTVVELLPRLQRRSVMTLLPLLDAACRLTVHPGVNDEDAQESIMLLSHSVLSRAAQPDSIWRSRRVSAARGQSVRDGASARQILETQLTELLLFSMVGDSHTSLVLTQLQAAAEEEEEERMEDEFKQTGQTPASCRGTSFGPRWEGPSTLAAPEVTVCATAKHIAGFMVRQLLQSYQQIAREVPLSIFAAALAELLPTARVEEAQRLLGRLIPHLAATLCRDSGQAWWVAAAASFGTVSVVSCMAAQPLSKHVVDIVGGGGQATAPPRAQSQDVEPSDGGAVCPDSGDDTVNSCSSSPASAASVVLLAEQLDTVRITALHQLTSPHPAVWSALVVHVTSAALHLQLGLDCMPVSLDRGRGFQTAEAVANASQTLVDRMSRFLSTALMSMASAVASQDARGNREGDLDVQQTHGRMLVAWGAMRELVATTAAVARAGMDVSCLQALVLMQLEDVCRLPCLTPCEGASQVPWSTLQPEMICLVQPLPPAMGQMLIFAAEQLCSEQ